MNVKKIFSALAMFATFAAFAADNDFVITDVPTEQGAAKIEWIKPACFVKDRYLAWSTLIARQNGELIAVFSGDRNAKMCFSGKIQLIRSGDSGKTWSAPETVYSSIVDDRDAGVCEMPDGNLLVSFYSGLDSRRVTSWQGFEESKIVFKNTTEKERATALGNWQIHSVDTVGRKWARPVRTYTSAPHGAVALSNKSLLYVGKHRDRAIDPHENPEQWWKDRSTGKIFAEESKDLGRTWNVIGEIPVARKFVDTDKKTVSEPCVVECSNGMLLVQMRRQDKTDPDKPNAKLLQSESFDFGRTWTLAHEVDIEGYPPHLLNLGDRGILCTYAKRVKGKEGVYAKISGDFGKTWGGEIRLAGALEGSKGDAGYPSSVVLKDGSLLTMFYTKTSAGVGLYVVKWNVKPAKK